MSEHVNTEATDPTPGEVGLSDFQTLADDVAAQRLPRLQGARLRSCRRGTCGRAGEEREREDGGRLRDGPEGDKRMIERPATHLDIHDHIEQLVTHHTNRAPYTHRNGQQLSMFTHLTMVPPLIDQLDNPDTGTKGDIGGGSGYTSRPAASLEALDTLMFIDDEAARWVRKLGEDDPGDTKACIRRVHALHPSQTPAIRADIERAVRRWWSQARITSGWDSPAWRPDNTCPVCEQRRSLRIKLADQMGFCVECRSVWSSEEIGLLADWIRLENAEDADTDELPLDEEEEAS